MRQAAGRQLRLDAADLATESANVCAEVSATTNRYGIGSAYSQWTAVPYRTCLPTRRWLQRRVSVVPRLVRRWCIGASDTPVSWAGAAAHSRALTRSETADQREDAGRWLSQRAVELAACGGPDSTPVRRVLPFSLIGAGAASSWHHPAETEGARTRTQLGAGTRFFQSGPGSAHENACRQRRTFTFLGKSGHTLRVLVRRSWLSRGQPPLLQRVSKRRELSKLIAITEFGQLAAWHVRGSVHGPDVIRVLQHFLRHFGWLLTVWDRLNVRRDRRVKAFLATHKCDFLTYELPVYALELKPEEQANAIIKATPSTRGPHYLKNLSDTYAAPFATCGNTLGWRGASSSTPGCMLTMPCKIQ